MLVNLHVKNFALIDEAEIDFTDGLNILTGETGAGKSILIDAVSAVLGLRTGSEVIRKGSDSAYAELVFAVPEQEKKEQLQEMNISTEYDCIVISRRILPNRSIHKINDETVTSATVRKVTELLLDIHGQHEHQSLLKASRHREILDAFAGPECRRLKFQTAEAYRLFREADAAAERFTVSQEDRQRRIDFLQFEVDEIENAQIKPNEKDELTEKFRRMSHFEKIRTALSETLREIGGDSPSCAGEAVSRAVRAIGNVEKYGEELNSIKEQLIQIGNLLYDTVRETEAYLEEAEFDEQTFRETEERLDLIHHLESKYGTGADELDRCLEERRKELDSWLHYEEELAQAEQNRQDAEEKLIDCCRRLHQLRTAAAPQLEERITEALSELNFLSVLFQVDIRENETCTADGSDTVEFLIALNPGEDPQPLGRVASGGELSRIMLAIKTLLADKDDIPTVIFDEVDSGISGRTAQMVGVKLKEISRYRQVILITHLPQIAAMADTHIGISKTAEDGRTVTSVRLLNEEEAVREIARLLGGMNLGDAVMTAARELKAAGKE